MAILVENLEKVYKSKKGAEVRALKGISFNLPDTGMVFILGKSGCGKSTLLNLLGGLDGFDGGDIKIEGKSLKGYKSKDLNRLRNDYIGFVFQENNLFEKDSVQNNVALALDLQNKKDTEGRVESVLESVELKELADKKCNCLSGGQKQRVAIARALVKSPKLLLCDEPTGALDSETGATIFSLLKELSKERLVVVVSHDRESAEKYGDRVIELKDGEIISDSAPLGTAETAEKPDPKHGGLRFLRALKTGVGYIIARPVRMALCLLICLITFTSAGVFDTLNAYDRDKALLYTMENMQNKCYSFGEVSRLSTPDRRLGFDSPEMKLSRADELSSLLDVNRVDYIYNFDVDGLNTYLTNINNFKPVIEVRLKGYVETDGSFCEDYGFPLLAGRLPENTGEVALPLFIFNFFKAFGFRVGSTGAFYNDGEIFDVNSYEDVIGKAVTLGGLDPMDLTVTGIIDTNFNFKEQAEILYNVEHRDKDKYVTKDFQSEMEVIELDVIHYSMFVCKGFDAYITETRGGREENKAILRVIAPFKGSEKQKLKNIRLFPVGEKAETNPDYYYYYPVNYCASKVIDAGGELYQMKKQALYTFVVLIVVSALFIMYYVSGTLNEKRREIGILRALGASRGDIFKVTACEHGTFTAFAVAISTVASAIATVILDNSFTKKFGFGTTFIKFGIRQFGVIAAVAILAVVAGIAFPLVRLLIKKPVDVIADRK